MHVLSKKTKRSAGNENVSNYWKQLLATKMLVKKATNKDKAFHSQFNLVFPDFRNNLITLAPNLIESEIRICSYIKLGFITKEIAYYTESTERSIESKKYRIRKKLGLINRENLYSYIMNIDCG